MIKEFWQEQKDKKKEQKELKKQNKKTPKTKEEWAYKIFGICFVIFLIVGSLIYSCNAVGSISGYSWDKLIGISEEMQEKLQKPVDINELIINKKIDTQDWENCKECLKNANLNIIADNEFDNVKLISNEVKLQSTFVLEQSWFGAFANKLINLTTYSDSIELIEVNFIIEESEINLSSLFLVDLTAIVPSSSLPKIYVRATSDLTVLNNQVFCLNSIYQFNQFTDAENEEILSILDKSSVVGIDYYTNELISREINFFSESISANPRINNSKIELIKKQNL